MKEITGYSQFYGVLGSPIKHSISPQMHNEAFRQLGLNYIYLAFEVNEHNLQSTLAELKTLNIHGFNVTMPNKNLMATLCDKLSPAAEITGSVNTVVNNNGILTGYTTDGTGYMRAVKDAGYDIIGKKMTLLGAGGASTSIFVQAALDGLSEISIFSRSTSSFNTRAKSIIDKLKNYSSCKVNLYDLEDRDLLKYEIQESAILTNGTSVGMAPDIDASIITDSSFFHKDLIVSDIIYNPRETKLLRIAKEFGCPSFNGLYMLLYQGAEAFKIWTGQDMPIDIIKAKYFN